ncbi:MAG: Ldh family oxidoreductase [Planctomycetaceae bacterium]|nr:Ldh family oxidoreductase [Planctomycetaceae bacterium]
MSNGQTNVPTAVLQEWMLKVLTRKGQFAADAQLVIARVLEAEIAARTIGGLASFANILTAIDLGDVDPRARTLPLIDAPAMAVLDGSTGIGQVGASRAMTMAIQKSQTTGIALVVVKNSQPEVDAAGIAALAAAAGCIGCCVSNWGRAVFPTQIDGPAWLSSQPHGWAIPHRDRVWTALRRAEDEALPSLASLNDAFRGVLSLALTVGLTDSKLPSAKKKSSPFGAGAEHTCIAIHIPSFSVTDSFTRIGDELAQQAGDGTAGWQLIPVAALSASVSVNADVLEALHRVGTESRVPFPTLV